MTELIDQENLTPEQLEQLFMERVPSLREEVEAFAIWLDGDSESLHQVTRFQEITALRPDWSYDRRAYSMKFEEAIRWDLCQGLSEFHGIRSQRWANLLSAFEHIGNKALED